jgi:tetratricopeptide (TPR) repeat protein
MSHDEIERLHELASEHYLRGEYRESHRAWQELLRHDPGDDRALEGVRMSRLLMDGAESDVESLAAPTPMAPGAPEPMSASEIRGRMEEIEALLEAGNLKEAVRAAGSLAARIPGSTEVQALATRAREAFEAEPFAREQLVAAESLLAAGDGTGAAAACRKALAVLPGLRDAAELLRRCEEAALAGIGGAAAGDVEFELDLALAERLGGPPSDSPASHPEPDAAPEPDPGIRLEADLSPGVPSGVDAAGRNEGIDFGDLSAVDSIPLAGNVPVDEPRRGIDGLAGSEAGPEDAGTLSESRTQPSLLPGAEPESRVSGLLEEAEAARSAGRRDEALSILARVFLVDENHLGARRLEASVREEMEQVAREMDHAISVGVQFFDQGNLDEAELQFKKVIAWSPSHREAMDFLAKIEASRAGVQTEPSGPEASFLGEVPPGFSLASDSAPPAGPALASPAPPRSDAAQPESIPVRRPPRPNPSSGIGLRKGPRSRPTDSDPVRFVPEPRRSSRSGLLVTFLLLALLGGAAFWWFYPVWLGEAASATPARPPVSQPAQGGNVTPTPAQASPAAAVPPATPRAQTATTGQLMVRAMDLMEAGDYAGAVLIYNQVLEIEPGHVEARAGLLKAGEKYKAWKSAQDQLEAGRAAFRDGDFATALRIFYRLPPSVDRAMVDRYKVNGWYNMGLTSLRAGDTREAMSNLGDALALRPDDAGAKQARSLAERYTGQVKNRAYYAAVEALPPRSLED